MNEACGRSLADCVAYFRARPGFARPLERIAKKYRSLGRVAGAVIISNATQAECDALRGLLGVPYSPPAVRFTLADFDSALRASAFALGLDSLLPAYLDEPLLTARQAKSLAHDAFAAFMARARGHTGHPICRAWLEAMEEPGQPGHVTLKRAYGRNAREAEQALAHACRGIEVMAEWEEQPLLAVWSARVTTDPHAFDAHTFTGQMLRYLADYYNSFEHDTAEGPPPLIDIRADSISSQVAQVGLRLYTGEDEHPAFMAFRQLGEPCVVTTGNLAGIRRADSPSGRVYLVENRMVFSQLCQEAHRFHAPLVCTSGQLGAASRQLIDLLVQGGCTLYYSGDFDPEGVTILSKLMQRHSCSIKPWRYDAQQYTQAMSQVAIAGSRLSMLEAVGQPQLAEVVRLMAQTGRAGYQELIIAQLLHDLCAPQP